MCFHHVRSRIGAALRHVDSPHRPQAFGNAKITLIRPVEATNDQFCAVVALSLLSTAASLSAAIASRLQQRGRLASAR
jgi:hypothetical protein